MPFRRRHSPGGQPVRALKTRVKWLWSANPQESATFVSDNARFAQQVFFSIHPMIQEPAVRGHPGGLLECSSKVPDR